MNNIATAGTFSWGDAFTGVLMLSAIVTLAFTAYNTYCQYVRRRKILFFNSRLLMSETPTLEVCLTNGGDVSIQIQDFSLWLKKPTGLGISYTSISTEFEIKGDTLILDPSKHLVVNFSIPESISPRELTEYGTDHDKRPHLSKLDIYFSIDMILADGKMLNRKAYLGSRLANKATGKILNSGTGSNTQELLNANSTAISEKIRFKVKKFGKWVERVMNPPDDSRQPKI
ncbi:hypothetical protein ACWPKS_08485 [Coraliomargarita sp. W4R72]